MKINTDNSRKQKENTILFPFRFKTSKPRLFLAIEITLFYFITTFSFPAIAELQAENSTKQRETKTWKICWISRTQ